MFRLLMLVVPVTVTAKTKFLIQLKLVPVVVGIDIGGVVAVAESASWKHTPPSALAHDTLAPVPICAWQVLAPIACITPYLC
jgi:hypothetical protein